MQVYRSDLDYTFKMEKKILPKWSCPHRIAMQLRNLYRLETTAGTPIPGDFSARRLHKFIPREGTQLYQDQLAHMEQLKEQGGAEQEWE